MTIQGDDSEPRGLVQLAGFTENGELVLEQTLSVVDYYEELHPIIDDEDAFRAKRGIRLVVGKIYDHDGKLDQEFKNEYAADGGYIRSRIVYSDGTVVED